MGKEQRTSSLEQPEMKSCRSCQCLREPLERKRMSMRSRSAQLGWKMSRKLVDLGSCQYQSAQLERKMKSWLVSS